VETSERSQSYKALKKAVLAVKASNSFVHARNPELRIQQTLSDGKNARQVHSSNPELARPRSARSDHSRPVLDVSRARSAAEPRLENSFASAPDPSRELGSLRAQLSRKLQNDMLDSKSKGPGLRGLTESPERSRSPSPEPKPRLPPRSETVVVVRSSSTRKAHEERPLSIAVCGCGMDCTCSEKTIDSILNCRETCFEEPKDRCLEFLEWWGKTFCCQWDWPNDCGCNEVLGRRMQRGLGCCWLVTFTGLISLLVYLTLTRN